MAKTPTDDDSSQQPTQKTTPTRRQNAEVEKEDHVEEREKLSDEQRKK